MDDEPQGSYEFFEQLTILLCNLCKQIPHRAAFLRLLLLNWRQLLSHVLPEHKDDVFQFVDLDCL